MTAEGGLVGGEKDGVTAEGGLVGGEKDGVTAERSAVLPGRIASPGRIALPENKRIAVYGAG